MKKKNKLKSIKNKNLLENLLVFLKIEKSNHLIVSGGIGIKFLINFRKKIINEIKINQVKQNYIMFLAKHSKMRIFTTNLMARFIGDNTKIKMFQTQNIINKKDSTAKIYIEESLDEIKTYLEKRLIQLIIKNNPIVGRCWLWIKNSSNNIRDFWFHYLKSCFNFMTGIESSKKKFLTLKNESIKSRNKSFMDYEFEFSTFPPKDYELILNCSGLNALGDFKMSKKNSKLIAPLNYMKNITWRNRFFSSKNIFNSRNSIKNQKMHYKSVLLLV